MTWSIEGLSETELDVARATGREEERGKERCNGRPLPPTSLFKDEGGRALERGRNVPLVE